MPLRSRTVPYLLGPCPACGGKVVHSPEASYVGDQDEYRCLDCGRQAHACPAHGGPRGKVLWAGAPPHCLVCGTAIRTLAPGAYGGRR